MILKWPRAKTRSPAIRKSKKLLHAHKRRFCRERENNLKRQPFSPWSATKLTFGYVKEKEVSTCWRLFSAGVGPESAVNKSITVGICPWYAKFHTSLRVAYNSTFRVNGVTRLRANMGEHFFHMLLEIAQTVSKKVILSTVVVDRCVRAKNSDPCLAISRKNNKVSILAFFQKKLSLQSTSKKERNPMNLFEK